ncbi:MAG: hypothetical protein PWP31_1619 [Clostridia bacterium]|nr:hypothetical protein [Clostridia bacterium]
MSMLTKSWKSWGQDIFIDGLAEYIRQFLKHAFEEAIRLGLQEMLGCKPYERGESTSSFHVVQMIVIQHKNLAKKLPMIYFYN